MAATRAVRIPRSSPPAPEERREEPPPWTGPGGFVKNEMGAARAVRLFLLFVLLLAAIYVGFLALLLDSRAGTGTAPVAALLSAVALLLVLWAWRITWGRAPRGLRWMPDGSVVVLERGGSRRRYPGPPDLKVSIAYRYSSGLLNARAVELVEVAAPGVSKRAYLVDAGAFERARPAPG